MTNRQQKRIAIYGGNADLRRKKLAQVIKGLEGDIGWFTADPSTVMGDAMPVPYGVPVVQLKFDHIVVDDSDALPKVDHFGYTPLFSWAKTMIVVFPFNKGKTARTKVNESIEGDSAW